jgi:cell division inhibitor SulA
MEQSLLEIAKAVHVVKKRRVAVRVGELDVVIGYLEGSLTYGQAAHALREGKEIGNGSITHRIGSVLRWAVAEGKIKIVRLDG